VASVLFLLSLVLLVGAAVAFLRREWAAGVVFLVLALIIGPLGARAF
jgi:hypothetical protein